MGGIAQKSFSVFRTTVVIYALQIPLSGVIARSLGPTGFGMWLILLTIPTYAEVLGRLQLDEASIYFIGRGRYRVGDVAFTLVLVSLASSAAIAGVFLALREFLFSNVLRSLAGHPAWVYLMIPYIVLAFLILNYSYLLLAREDVRGYNVQRLTFNLLAYLAGAVLVVSTGLGIAGLIYAQLALGAVALVIGFRRAHREERFRFHGRWDVLRGLSTFAGKLYLLSILGYLNTYVSGLLVILYMDPSHVAFYRIALNVALLMTNIPGAVATVLYPRIARVGRDRSQARLLTSRAIRTSMILLVASMLTGLALIRPVVLLVYGSRYASAVVPFLILAPATVLYSGTGLVRQHFMGLGRLWMVVILSIVPLAFQVALVALLTPHLGLGGASAGTAIAYVVAGLAHVAAFARVERVPFRRVVIPTHEDFHHVLRWIGGKIARRRRHEAHAAPDTDVPAEVLDRDGSAAKEGER